MTRGKTREYAASEVLEWMRSDTPMIQVRTGRDSLPGGLAMAMAPGMVDWIESSLGYGPDSYYRLHNVNVASNPVGGSTLLGTAHVPAGGVDFVEFVMVISKVGRLETDAGHAQLRFEFKEDQRPTILSNDGTPLANDAAIDDLVLSWEAWRPPGAGFDAVAGLDPETYALTMRCFNGSARAMTDAILDRPWVCYRLRLPDVADAANELLYVSLLMGDAVARQTVGEILQRRIEEGGNMPSDYEDGEAEDWAQIKTHLERIEVPENPIQEILEGKTRYHLLARSCITMALMTLDWANVRTHRRGGLGEPPRVKIAPESVPGMLDNLVQGNRRATLVRIPAALHWLMRNQTVIPGRAHELLDEVGLLERRNGELVKSNYDNRKQSPYGVVGNNIIY